MTLHRLPIKVLAASLVACIASTAHGQIVYQGVTGTLTWNAGTSWNPATIPNAVGANATFNGAATAQNPAQTGNRTTPVDGAKTVGSIVFNTDLSTFTNTVSTGTGGPLTFDEGAGPATMMTMGAGTGNNTISVAMVFTDDVVATVNNTAALSAAGSLNLTGTITGPGGFTKTGDGLATFGTGTKTYTGPTVVNGGRMRISVAAAPTATSSFTVNAGGQLTFTAAAGTFNLGAGNLFLNGSGPTTGPFANGGAIRPDRTTNPANYTIANNTVLQSNSVIHVQAQTGTGATSTPIDSVTITGVVSGPGRLQLTAANSDVDQGTLTLTNANTYTGGTLVFGGILSVTGGSAVAAGLGTGNVTVDQGGPGNAPIARLSIAGSSLNAIDDLATLALAGGGAAGVADQNFAILAGGVNEVVGGLVLGGIAQALGTYGATGSGATNINDEFFSGAGIITVGAVPEPGTLALAGLAAAGLVARRVRRKANAG